jgi:hypothetical protein
MDRTAVQLYRVGPYGSDGTLATRIKPNSRLCLPPRRKNSADCTATTVQLYDRTRTLFQTRSVSQILLLLGECRITAAAAAGCESDP